MKFTIDFSKWRCGFKDVNKLGEGSTYLWNLRGYGCCLGHFGLCLGISEDSMLGAGSPMELGPQSRERFTKVLSVQNVVNLIQANDDETIITEEGPVQSPTTQQRLKVIESILEKRGHTLEVTNKEPVIE